MKINRTVEYGFIAVVYVAQNCKDGLVLARNISEANDISMAYLMQIMMKLAIAGILTSKKGPNGGFVLARPAAEITLLEIMEVLDGPVIVPLSLLGQTDKPFAKKVEKVFLNVSKAMRANLAKVTIADVAGK